MPRNRKGAYVGIGIALLTVSACEVSNGSIKNCRIAADTNWTAVGMMGNVESPEECPLHLLSSGEITNFALRVGAPESRVGTSSRIDVWVFNIYTYPSGGTEETLVSPQMFDFFRTYEDSASIIPAYVTGHYSAGTRPRNISAFDGTDQARALVSSLVAGPSQAVGRINLPFELTPHAKVTGHTQVNPGSYSWNATVTKVAQNPVSYQWYVNGSAISGATSPTYNAYVNEGPFNLMLVARDAASWRGADTVLHPVRVTLSGTMSGPTEVRPTYACTWYVSARGGTPPYHYAWFIDDQPVPNNDVFSWSGLLSGGGHSISVDVSDSDGQVTNIVRGVTVIKTAPSCDI